MKKGGKINFKLIMQSIVDNIFNKDASVIFKVKTKRSTGNIYSKYGANILISYLLVLSVISMYVQDINWYYITIFPLKITISVNLLDCKFVLQFFYIILVCWTFSIPKFSVKTLWYNLQLSTYKKSCNNTSRKKWNKNNTCL